MMVPPALAFLYHHLPSGFTPAGSHHSGATATRHQAAAARYNRRGQGEGAGTGPMGDAKGVRRMLSRYCTLTLKPKVHKTG